MKMHAALCGLLLAVTVNVNAESLDWLKIVAFAAHQTDYSGVFVYQYDNRVETSRITHVVEADGEYEKLESLDGPKRKILRHHGQVWCYINHKMVQVDSQQVRIRFPAFLPEQISALNANYQTKQVGVARVAGYSAQVILLEPMDNLRYAHKIWAHTGSGLLLKAAVLGDKNQTIEQYAFTQLQIGGDIDRSWTNTTAPGNSLPASPEVGSGGTPVNSGWVVEALPAGFKKTMEIQRPMRGRPVPVTQIVFSDGLSAISVFIEPDNADEDNASGLSSRGAVNLYHKAVAGQLFTVVGEVPARTVIQVLDSIRYKGK
ncbi:MAG TPA: MucB/RseB C-terminal domain-containing protein [Gallionella sp.]|nr:MucB/RseB C-terminal domain-containing protein [Gallionella sp.]